MITLMAAARRRSLADEHELGGVPPGPESARDELVDVPAAVMCAICGSSDCPGCAEERSRSGVISIVAWERPGGSLERVWSTSRAATMNAEAFFESLPDGPVGPAFKFAFFAEIIAASVMLGLAGAVVLFAALALGGTAALDFGSIGFILRVAFAGVFGLASLLVGAHSAHGLALGVAARRRGGKASLSRALRFGLYSCGWDLVLGPIGFVAMLSEKRSVVGLAVGLPTRAALAFLRGTYRLEGDEAKGPLHASYVAAVVATLTCALALLGAIAVVLFG